MMAILEELMSFVMMGGILGIFLQHRYRMKVLEMGKRNEVVVAVPHSAPSRVELELMESRVHALESEVAWLNRLLLSDDRLGKAVSRERPVRHSDEEAIPYERTLQRRA